jgi:hypothetical protein
MTIEVVLKLVMAIMYATQIVFGMTAAKMFAGRMEFRWAVLAFFVSGPFINPAPLWHVPGQLTCLLAGWLIGRRFFGRSVPVSGSCIKLHRGPVTVTGTVFYSENSLIVLIVGGDLVEFEKWDRWEYTLFDPPAKKVAQNQKRELCKN